jgi:hypothetical protein
VHRGVDAVRGGGVAGWVVVECEHDPFDADVGEAFEEAAIGGGSAERGDWPDAVGAQDVNVHHAFDKQNLCALVAWAASERVGESVGDRAAAWRAA